MVEISEEKPVEAGPIEEPTEISEKIDETLEDDSSLDIAAISEQEAEENPDLIIDDEFAQITEELIDPSKERPIKVGEFEIDSNAPLAPILSEEVLAEIDDQIDEVVDGNMFDDGAALEKLSAVEKKLDNPQENKPATQEKPDQKEKPAQSEVKQSEELPVDNAKEKQQDVETQITDSALPIQEEGMLTQEKIIEAKIENPEDEIDDQTKSQIEELARIEGELDENLLEELPDISELNFKDSEKIAQKEALENMVKPPSAKEEEAKNKRDVLPKRLMDRKFVRQNRHTPVAILPGQYRTLFFMGIRSGDINTTKSLLKLLGGDPNKIKNSKGETPLTFAILNNRIQIVYMLISKGANPDLVNDFKKTPLRLAIDKNNVEIARILLEMGADVELPGASDETPLMYATTKGSFAMVDTLIKNGANVNALDRGKHNALSIAKRMELKLITDLLIKNGAKMPPKRKVKQRTKHPIMESIAPVKY